ncbi:MAG: DUF4261 domain-containing protein [Planctomycetes bacterium]|nr:DUF4261 domain-containing protein [Planctomycetota bacterium]
MAISIAMVMLGPGAKLSAEAIQQDLKSTWPALPAIGNAEQEEVTLSFRVGEADLILGRMPAPIPWSDLEGPCATSWLWPDAAEKLKQHAEHVIVTVSSEASPVERSRLLTQVVAAIVATCKAPVGVFWTNAAMVISPSMFRDFAVDVLPHGPPIHMWVDFRVGKTGDRTSSGFTSGLAALDLMEFETQNANEPPGELRERLIALAGYVVENGPVINDGDTVGEDANERIRVVYSKSAFGHEGKVMRLDYSTAQSKKPWWKIW